MSTTITVEGMSCEHCEQTGATTDREAEQAVVEGEADAAALVAAVEDAGYDAEA